jgi:hypothetical protein
VLDLRGGGSRRDRGPCCAVQASRRSRCIMSAFLVVARLLFFHYVIFAWGVPLGRGGSTTGFAASSWAHSPCCVPRASLVLPVVAWIFPRPDFNIPWEARIGLLVSAGVCVVVLLVVSKVGGAGVRQARGLPCTSHGLSGFPRTAPVWGEPVAR